MAPNMIQTGYDRRLFGEDGQETKNRLQSGLLLADLGFFIIHFFHGFHPVVCCRALLLFIASAHLQGHTKEQQG